MKMRATIFAAAIGLLAAACLPAINWAQEGDDPFAREQMKEQEKMLHAQADAMRAQAEAAKHQAHMAAEAAKIRVRSMFRGPGHSRHLTEIHEQAAKYRDADDEQDKSTAMKNLNEVVDKCFEDDMKVREQELAGIEERLNKLREQLERRRSKKQEIVDLQVKVAINEAEGLGFFSEAKGDMFKFRVPVPVVMPLDGKPFPAPPSPPTPIGVGGEGRGMTAILPVKVRSDDIADPLAVSPPLAAHGTTVVFGEQVILDRQPLSVGAEGDAVRLLQFQLNEYLEPSPGLAVDGDFGPETEKAVKAFQKEHDLEVTGVADDATRKVLDTLPSSSPSPDRYSPAR